MSTLQTPTSAPRQPSVALILTAALVVLAVAAAVVAFTATGDGGEPSRTESILPSHVKTHGGAPVPERPELSLPSHGRMHGGAPVPDLSVVRR